MSEFVIFVVGVAFNLALVAIAARITWWLFRKIIGGAGAAWRGDIR